MNKVNPNDLKYLFLSPAQKAERIMADRRAAREEDTTAETTEHMKLRQVFRVYKSTKVFY